MGDNNSSPDFKDFDARLKKARQVHHRPGRQASTAGPLGIAMRLSVEMVAGLLVGGGIGYFLDKWLGSSPWLLILFFFFGAAAGLRNVKRAADEMSRQMEREVDDGDENGSPPS